MNNYKTIETMEKFGGGFVKALAECWYRADEINKEKLEVAFADYFKEYKKVTKWLEKKVL